MWYIRSQIQLANKKISEARRIHDLSPEEYGGVDEQKRDVTNETLNALEALSQALDNLANKFR